MTVKAGEWFFRNRDWTPVPFWLILFITTFIWKDRQTQINFLIPGYSLILFGELVRMACIKRARSITRTRSGKTGERLIREGLFRFSRNPIYVGNGLIGLGLTFLSSFFLAPIIFFFLFFMQYSLVIAYEESVLEGKFGEEYRKYKKFVPRWIGVSKLEKQPETPDLDIYGFGKILKSERHTFLSILVIAFLLQLSSIINF